MTISSIVTATISSYAAIVSTLSLVLALKVFKAGDPEIDLGWEYSPLDRKLSLIVSNTSRSDVTVSTIELYIIHEEVMHQTRNKKYFRIRTETIGHIPAERWHTKDIAIPVRLVSYSTCLISVRSEEIRLPSELPLNDLLLKFVAKYPGGKQIVYMRGEPLRHFIGIELNRPIEHPSRGSILADD